MPHSPTPADIYKWSLTSLQTAIDSISASFMQLDIVPTGAIDGVNTTFTTPTDFSSTHLVVYYNGQRLCLTDDFTLSPPNTFTLLSPPYPGDKIRVDYIPAV